MRHAHAADPDAWRGPDKARPLSDAGTASLEQALAHMRRRRLSAEALLTSPYERANQTAEVVARELHILQTIQCPELAAGARLDAFLSLVKRFFHFSPLWIVGHMPDLMTFASRLTGEAAGLERPFSPGEMLAVDCAIDGGVPAEGRTLWRRRLDEWMAA